MEVLAAAGKPATALRVWDACSWISQTDPDLGLHNRMVAIGIMLDCGLTSKALIEATPFLILPGFVPHKQEMAHVAIPARKLSCILTECLQFAACLEAICTLRRDLGINKSDGLHNLEHQGSIMPPAQSKAFHTALQISRHSKEAGPERSEQDTKVLIQFLAEWASQTSKLAELVQLPFQQKQEQVCNFSSDLQPST